MARRVRVYTDPNIRNVERFDAPSTLDVHVDQALSNISIAYRNENYIADQVFPIVPVKKQSDLYFVFEKSGWFRDEAGPRGVGARAPRVDYFIKRGGPYAAVEYAAAKGVPDEVVDNADNPLAPQREATDFVTEKLLLRLEVDVAGKVFTAANWTNSGAPNSGANSWGNDTSDPINDVVGPGNVRETLRQAIGRYPNTLVLGAKVFAALKRHPDLLDRVRYTSPTYGIDTGFLQKVFEVEKILIGTAIYDTAKEGAASTLTDVWGNSAWFGYVPPNPGLMTPAAGYVFAWRQRQVNRYRELEEHQDMIECLMSWATQITSPDSGFLLTSVV